jgi:hypothetical protein
MRLIDADALKKHWNTQDVKCGEYTAFHFLESIDEQPTIEERKAGEWTTEQVAELLANLFGDECACNFSGIDEWLPSACKYSETDCPEPKEKHGCWMQFLMQGGADMRGEQHEAY